jgi:hypothetical protein
MIARGVLVSLMLFGCAAAHGDEVSSNALGGGPWSDPATWRGDRVPAAGDIVIVQKNDIVTYDGSRAEPTCQKLQVDAKGVLLFKTGGGDLVLSVNEGIECFGTIKLDGTKAVTDRHELQLVGARAEQRKVLVGKGASLLVYGHAELPDGKRNVAITSPQPTEGQPHASAVIETEESAGIDFRFASLADVQLVARKIDNTGIRPHEKLNISDCHFTGDARIFIGQSDSPTLLRNTFAYTAPAQLEAAALMVVTTALAEIRGNRILGKYRSGIRLEDTQDAVLVGNTVDQCQFGFHLGNNVPGTMLKRGEARSCQTGVAIALGSGVLEDLLIEKCQTSLHMANSQLQVSNLNIREIPEQGVAIQHDGGTLSLLNANVAPADIKFTLNPAATLPLVHSLQFLIVGVKDVAAGSLIEVRTANPALAADAADPNVRNSPAPLIEGRTPPATALNALSVKAWTIETSGAVSPGPEYSVKVLGPAQADGTRSTVNTATYKPVEKSFREKLTDAAPTMEVP